MNQVSKTSDIDTIFRAIAYDDPLSISYCLKQNSDGTFSNVYYVPDTDSCELKKESRPIGLRGDFMNPQLDTGTVTTITDTPTGGYSITGFDGIDLTCPSGYNMPHADSTMCTFIPICRGVEEDKPITYTTFQALGLGLNSFTVSHSQAKSETTHPRLWIHCLSSNPEDPKYQIYSCNDNELLDADMKCQPYDICSNKISGFKHKFITEAGQTPLLDNQYYVCKNHVSFLATCPDESVYSVDNMTCLNNGPCFGQGSKQIQVDSNNYIQCANDLPTMVNCTDGVIETNGYFSCYGSSCVPRTYEFEDIALKYLTGQVTCQGDKEISLLCSNSKDPSKQYPYEWGENFSYTFENWPMEILNPATGVCEAPTDSIIKQDNSVPFKYSSVMTDFSQFDLVTQQFKCPGETTYRWDYINNQTVPELKPDEFLDTAAPCQPAGPYKISLDSKKLPPWHYLPYKVFPPKRTQNPDDYPPLLIGVRFPMGDGIMEGGEGRGRNTWPTFNSTTGRVITCVLEDNGSKGVFWNMHFSAPLGFNEPTEDGPLIPVGFDVPQTILDDDTISYLWYTINSGLSEFSGFVFAEEPAMAALIRTTDTSVWSFSDNGLDRTFFLRWKFLPVEGIRLNSHTLVTRLGFETDGVVTHRADLSLLDVRFEYQLIPAPDPDDHQSPDTVIEKIFVLFQDLEVEIDKNTTFIDFKYVPFNEPIIPNKKKWTLQ